MTKTAKRTKRAENNAIEENALRWMRLLTHWLNFWIEDKELPPEERLDVDFGIREIEELQKKLERLKEHLLKSKN